MQITILTITLLGVLQQIALSASQQTCGNLNREYLYNNNNETALREHPWMGLIWSRLNDPDNEEPRKITCMGVLITKRNLISPAHCVIDDKVYFVVLGDWNFNNDISDIDCDRNGECGRVPPQEYELEEIAINPNFNSTVGWDNDIAILTLTKEVTVNDYVQPICIFPPSTPESNYLTQYLNLVGLRRGPIFPMVRSKTLAHITNSKRCNEIFSDGKLSDNHICGHVNDDRHFVSGSALMGVKIINDSPSFYYLIGIATSGSSRKIDTVPSVFMRMQPYKDWILRNTA